MLYSVTVPLSAQETVHQGSRTTGKWCDERIHALQTVNMTYLESYSNKLSRLMQVYS